MLSVIFKSVFCFFAVYGLIDMTKRFISCMFSVSPSVKDDVFIVVKIKKPSVCVEAVVRSIIWRSLSTDGGGFVPNILIVDMGCDAEGSNVAQRLCDEYGFIYYTTYDEYEGMKTGFLKNDKDLKK